MDIEDIPETFKTIFDKLEIIQSKIDSLANRMNNHQEWHRLIRETKEYKGEFFK